MAVATLTGSSTSAAQRTAAATAERPRWGWIYLFWMLMLTTFASFRSRHATELLGGAGIDAQVQYQLAIWVLFGGLAAWQLLNGRVELRLLGSGPLFWFACFGSLALLSSVHSAMPALTFFRSGQLLIALVLVVSLGEAIRDVHRLALLYIGVNTLLVLIAAAGLDGGIEWIRGPGDSFLPRSGTAEVPWRFASAFGHPSLISIAAACAALSLAARSRGGRWWVSGPVILWMLLVLLLTASRTAIAGFLGGAAVLVVTHRKFHLPALAAVTVGSAMLMVPVVQDRAARYLLRGQDATEFKSLTGRDVIYSAALERATAALPWGEGFQGGRVEVLDEQGAEVGIAHAHNLLLECLIGNGFAGLLIGCLFLASLCWRVGVLLWAQRQGRSAIGDVDNDAVELAAVICPLLAFCILDRGFAAPVDPVVLLFLAVAGHTQKIWLAASDRYRAAVATRQPSEQPV